MTADTAGQISDPDGPNSLLKAPQPCSILGTTRCGSPPQTGHGNLGLPEQK